MRLDELTGDSTDAAAAAVGVSSLSYDSRTTAPGALFFCVSGFERDGHDFLGVWVCQI